MGFSQSFAAIVRTGDMQPVWWERNRSSRVQFMPLRRRMSSESFLKLCPLGPASDRDTCLSIIWNFWPIGMRYIQVLGWDWAIPSGPGAKEICIKFESGTTSHGWFFVVICLPVFNRGEDDSNCEEMNQNVTPIVSWTSIGSPSPRASNMAEISWAECRKASYMSGVTNISLLMSYFPQQISRNR
jgi:hypothetical protein